MNPHTGWIALLVLASALLPGQRACAATVQVQVGQGGLKFSPKNVSVQAGDTVEWVWAVNGHSSTSGTPGNPDGLWDSGVQNIGFTFSHTFPSAGTFTYYCTVHGACCGMIGSVVVSSPAAGAVFVNANSATNKVAMYDRGTDGQLSLVGTFGTQGSGSSGGLDSQGSVTITGGHEYVYAVNAGSNDITAFRVTPAGLTFIGKVPSGGTFPRSVSTAGNFLYVLNAEGPPANITGFTIQADGSLVAIPNSTRRLSAGLPNPAQISFTPDGTTLVVSERGTNLIDTYAVSADGTSTGPLVQASAGRGPYGFSFDGASHLVVSEVIVSSASSYTISDGVLQVVTAHLKDLGRAACWAICTTDPGLPQQYAYVSNSNSDTISGYVIATDGSLSLVNADGKTAVLPSGALPIDLAISSDNQYLYVLEQKLPGIAVFQIQPDGNLVQIQSVTTTSRHFWGMTGY
jgi:6-phosphogluconolactonase